MDAYRQRRVALEVYYLGWAYHGFASQTGLEATIEVLSWLLCSVETLSLSGAWLTSSSVEAAAAVSTLSCAAGPAVCGAAADTTYRGGAWLGGAGVLALRAHRQGRQRPLPGMSLPARAGDVRYSHVVGARLYIGKFRPEGWGKLIYMHD